MSLSFFRAVRAALSAAVILSATTTAQAQEFGVPVDGNFSEFEIAFTGGLGVVYRGVFDVRAVEGQIAICGVGHLRDSRLRSTIRDMARNGAFILNGQEYPFDMRYFSRARTINSIPSTEATCRLTGVAAPRSGSVNLRFGNGVFRN